MYHLLDIKETLHFEHKPYLCVLYESRINSDYSLEQHYITDCFLERTPNAFSVSQQEYRLQ
jgi:hypothetical protein